MSTLIDDGSNPSGIVFDDPGPGAGVKAPAPGTPGSPIPPASKLAAVAAKAKKTPGTVPGVKAVAGPAKTAAAAAPAKKAAPLKGVTASYGYELITAERYKAGAAIEEAVNRLNGRVVGIVTSAGTQNAYDVLIEFTK